MKTKTAGKNAKEMLEKTKEKPMKCQENDELNEKNVQQKIQKS